jgi:serine protease inhibitor
VFTDQAELGELADDQDLTVSRIVHKAVVEVSG